MTVIEAIIYTLTQRAWVDRADPTVYRWARHLTYPEVGRHDKVRAIVAEVRRQFRFPAGVDPATAETLSSARHLLDAGRAVDADDACLLLATAAMSVGIPCRFVAARYRHSWTCWVAYQVGERWQVVDPLLPPPTPEIPGEPWEWPLPERKPDETVWGPPPWSSFEDRQ